jgi:NADP-dependent 3-hydroxy acid dehydrogenase YdfG
MQVAGRPDGKVAVVTGASSGIGEATVWALAAEGAAVVAGARHKERLDELVEEVSQNGAELARCRAQVP